ncbi:hypothetical protein Tco_0922501 [Tanacetum coccineum]|uniref:Uncharacterized protein n=1 Tax=Tanacetum coccineum TaxID=301880 RepID=A0ABQ5CZR8_9ASTR
MLISRVHPRTNIHQALMTRSSGRWDVGLGEADSETLPQKDFMKKAFQDMLHELGGVLSKSCILHMVPETSKDNEVPSWNTVSRQEKTHKTTSDLEAALEDFI